MRRSFNTLLATTVAAAVLLAASGASAQTRAFNVPAEDAAKAIAEFASQAGVQITAPVSDLKGVRTPAITGQQDVRAALAKLIEGTGLEVASDDGSTIVLRRKLAAQTSAQAETEAQPDTVSGVVVVGRKTIYGNNSVTKPMIQRQSVLTSVNDVLNELPGVLVTEADAFGSTDNATTISIRGFDTLHIGETIDGMPNGGSRFGGGSKANRYLDVLDLDTVHVSQGTEDISSATNEALAGSLDYISSNPLHDSRLRFVLAGGDQNARQYYVRADTGEILPNTYAWFSALTSSVTDWMDGQAHTTRSHVAAKITSKVAGFDLTGYGSFDESNEVEYGAVSPAQFANNPKHDSLTETWTGIPYYDQYYRQAWGDGRQNLFGYLKAHRDFGEVSVTLSGYGHQMRGHGDEAPPYLENVSGDVAGQPDVEYTGGKTIQTASALGNIYFVNPDGSTATKIAGCKGTAQLPAAYNPVCYPAGSIPVQSYRMTHYDYWRVGTLADLDWKHQFGDFTNVLRAGMWFEHGATNTLRAFYKITNPAVSDAYDAQPYWIQYSIDDGADEEMYYVEDKLTWGPLTGSVGVKQFFTDQWRQEETNTLLHTAIDKKSKPLLQLGVSYTTPLKGLELFSSYSQNFAGLQRNLLGGDQLQLDMTQPETSTDIEVGARYNGPRLYGSLTVYDIDFKNRITFVPETYVTGFDYLSTEQGAYINVGGVKSQGVEMALGYHLPFGLSLSGSYSYNPNKYVGTGNAAENKAAGVTPGVQVANSPKNMFNIAADWRRNNWTVGVSTKYVGDSYIDVAATKLAKAYVLTNAFVAVDLGEISQIRGLGVRINVNNLMDEHYLTGAGYIGYPRTTTAALTLDF